ncbi:MAG TPA: hypothetical protein VK151_01890 [Fluviicola sp.]|nr:hypothetical protein [Fluviicola sp.]
MKPVIAVLAIVLIAFSCSKNQRVSKKLEGSWTAKVLDGVETTSDFGASFTFAKEKNGEGTGSARYVISGEAFESDMTYFVKNSRITIVSGNEAVFFDILQQEDSKLILKNPEGDTTILTK